MARCMTAKLKCFGLALATAVVLVGCRTENDSPEAVYQAMYDADQAKDWEKMVGCLTPESHEVMAGMMVMMGAFMTMDEEQGPAIKELFARHGIEEPDEEPLFGEVTEPLSVDVRLSYEAPFFMTYETVDLPEPQAAPLYATLVLDGKPIAGASQVGFLQVDAARDDKGKDVALLKAEAEDLDVGGDFVSATGGVPTKEATRPLEIDLMLEGPSAEATSLAALEGSLKLLTGGQPEETLVDIKSIEPGAAVENEILKAAGVTLKIPLYEPQPEHGISITTQGPIWSIDLVDGKGKIVDGQSSGGMGSYLFQSETPLPDDAALKLVVLTGQKPQTVPFEFEDVPLPDEDNESPEGDDFSESGPSQEDLKEMAEPIKDKPAFIAEIFALMDQRGSLKSGPPGVTGGKLADVKIEGDTATAVQVTDRDGRQDREPIEFRKIDGRWFVHFSE